MQPVNPKSLLLPVHSDSLSALGWDDVSTPPLLLATFVQSPGWVYSYTNVDKRIYDLLMSIEEANKIGGESLQISLGRAFWGLIKLHPEKYPYQRVKLS
jgi:hypothetical protein